MATAGGLAPFDSRAPEKNNNLTALPRIGIAAAMAVFLVVRDVAPESGQPAYLQLIAVVLVLLVAFSGIIHMLTSVWDSHRIAFVALGGASVLAFVFLYGFEPRSYLLAVFWVVAEGALLLGLPVALGVWSAACAGYVLSELWTAPTWNLPSEPDIAMRVLASIAVALVAGSLTAAALALRTAQKERAVAERLRELDGIKNSFLEAVSHEMRTPLATILGFAMLLEARDDALTGEKRRSSLQALADSARKLNRLLTDLLDVDRLGRGIIEPQRRPTEVDQLIERVVRETPIGDHPVRVDVAPLVADVDGPKVERIVENLIANAAKHTHPGTPIHVRAEANGPELIVIVEDEGPGVPDEMKETIFTPFARGSYTTSLTPGVGIGLSLVSSFSELHGGRAWVEDRPGGGSSFRVLLSDAHPRVAAEHAADNEPVFRGELRSV